MANNSCLTALYAAGITHDDAVALRRISMTLHRWHELECGDSNQYGSWAITRGRWRTFVPEEGKPVRTFEHDDDERPFLEHHHYRHGAGKDTVTYSVMNDRERGALKRLTKIMARYPDFASYVQGDPRGCALYILRPGDLNTLENGDGSDISACYTRGIAVYK
jgi:hypothetical protein